MLEYPESRTFAEQIKENLIGKTISYIEVLQDGYYESSRQKPDPLSEEFTFSYFQNLYTPLNRKISAKAFLATEQRIPGVGNGVLQSKFQN